MDLGCKMKADRIPPGLIPAGSSLNFTRETIPEALQREHTLASGRWGVLHILEGSILFVDLETGNERLAEAPDRVIIHPGAPHKVVVSGPLTCRIDFFRDQGEESGMRAPGEYADEAVRLSLGRCEATGDFGEVFYQQFLNSSPEVPPLFSGTDLNRQKQVLRDSVHKLLSLDLSDPVLRQELDHLGRVHGRSGRNIQPRLYELWLDSICETAKALDPEWSGELDRAWRVRLRPGMQIVTAAY